MSKVVNLFYDVGDYFIDKNFKDLDTLKGYNFGGYCPNVADKIPSLKDILKWLNSLVIVNTNNSEYFVIKKKNNLNITGFKVVRDVRSITNYCSYINKNVIIPLDFSKFKELSIK